MAVLAALIVLFPPIYMMLAGVEPSVLVPESIREWFRCQVLRPLLRALRGGVTPRRLAWSLAMGMVVGINPSVGLTTLFVVLVAWVFGLSKLASLAGTHAVAPLHLRRSFRSSNLACIYFTRASCRWTASSWST